MISRNDRLGMRVVTRVGPEGYVEPSTPPWAGNTPSGTGATTPENAHGSDAAACSSHGPWSEADGPHALRVVEETHHGRGLARHEAFFGFEVTATSLSGQALTAWVRPGCISLVHDLQDLFNFPEVMHHEPHQVLSWIHGTVALPEEADVRALAVEGMVRLTFLISDRVGVPDGWGLIESGATAGCFWRAVQYAIIAQTPERLGLDAPLHELDLADMAAEHLRQADEYTRALATPLGERPMSESEWREYVHLVRDGTTPAGPVEILGLARALGITIVITFDRESDEAMSFGQGPEAYIRFCGDRINGHFDALYPARDDRVVPAATPFQRGAPHFCGSGSGASARTRGGGGGAEVTEVGLLSSFVRPASIACGIGCG
jgi:hypothetical protein